MHKHTPIKNILGGALGTLLEWYDYTLYGLFAPLFTQLFFPKGQRAVALLQVFGIFAVGYIARPIGALILGRLADVHGRKWVLILSMALMGIMTGLMGFLPTYETAGVLSPLLLVGLRLIQGASVGGEYMSASVFLVEHAPPHKRGRFGSLNNLAGGIGCLIASLFGVGVSTFLSHEQLSQFGWRLPFYFGLLTALAGLILRVGMEETPIFESLQKQHHLTHSPLKYAFIHQRRSMLICFCLVCLQAVSFYTTTVFLNSWMVQFENLSLQQSLISSSITFGMIIALTYVSGYLSDKFGRKPVLFYSALGFVLVTFPLFYWMERRTDLHLSKFIFGQALLSVFFAIYNGTLPAALTELFHPPSRCTALTLSYNVAAGILGGFTPIICTWLVLLTGHKSAPALYVIVFALLAIFALEKTNEMADHSLKRR